MKILIVNGPNLNLLGKREPALYGGRDFDSFFAELRNAYAPRGVVVEQLQSNVEGEIINFLHGAEGNYDGVILNAGGYTHTSVAIADAVRAITIPVVEVHISNLFAREEYRWVSLTGAACRGAITGFGLDSYKVALESFLIDKR